MAEFKLGYKHYPKNLAKYIQITIDLRGEINLLTLLHNDELFVGMQIINSLIISPFLRFLIHLKSIELLWTIKYSIL